MPVKYPGGKNGAGVYQQIINRIPPHEVYLEPFLGSGAIMRHLAPAQSAIGVDLVAENGAYIEALPHARFIHGCALTFLRDYPFTGREFVYLDPPYLIDLRSSDRDIYTHELTDAQHKQLLYLALELPCPVMISGYPSPLYDDVLGGWRCDEIAVTTRGGTAQECLWMNYEPPAVLHDLRYVGDDYRERDRIKKKARRWRDNLEAMPAHERQFILSTLLRQAQIKLKG